MDSIGTRPDLLSTFPADNTTVIQKRLVLGRIHRLWNILETSRVLGSQ